MILSFILKIQFVKEQESNYFHRFLTFFISFLIKQVSFYLFQFLSEIRKADYKILFLTKLKMMEYHYQHNDILKKAKSTIISDIVEYYYFTPSTAELKNIKNVADYFHYDKQYLARLFKKETGIRMYEFIQDIKIKKAKEALICSTKNVAEISKMLGYRTDYFQKLFKFKTGMTPIKFRRANSSSPDDQM